MEDFNFICVEKTKVKEKEAEKAIFKKSNNIVRNTKTI